MCSWTLEERKKQRQEFKRQFWLMLPFHCMKFRDILPEKATLIAVPLSNFNSFFSNYILKKKKVKILIRQVNADNLSSLTPTDVHTCILKHVNVRPMQKGQSCCQKHSQLRSDLGQTSLQAPMVSRTQDASSWCTLWKAALPCLHLHWARGTCTTVPPLHLSSTDNLDCPVTQPSPFSTWGSKGISVDLAIRGHRKTRQL